MKHYNKMARQAGMTLIELTVVLLVLIGLAGLMIPYVSGFMGKTHDSTGTNNVAALNNAIYRFQGEKMRLPDNMQSLIETSGGGNSNAVYGDMMNTSQFKAGAIGMEGSMSLGMAGIQTVYSMRDTTTAGSATFAAADVEATIGMGTILAELNTDAGEAGTIENLVEAFGGVASSYGAHSTGADGPIELANGCVVKYVAMGIGQESELTGSTISEAPIHFASQGDMGPESKYNRFIAVFKVDVDDGTSPANPACEPMVPAQFVGAAMAMSQDHLFGLSHSLSHTYENIAK